ncbi:MAG: OmpH family outer membrane protein [Candidatus Omnitrophota bacterium]
MIRSRNFLAAIVSAAVLLASLGMSSGTAQAQELKIGHISLRDVFNKAVKYKQAFEELKSIQQKKSEQLQQKESELKKSKYDIDMKKELMKEDDAKQLQDSFNKDVEEFQKLFQNEQKDFAKSRDDKLEPLNKELKQIIEDLAKKENYAFIFKFDDLLYADPKYDLTPKVIEALNKK